MGDGEMMGVCRPCVCMALAALERSFWAGEEGLWWCSGLVLSGLGGGWTARCACKGMYLFDGMDGWLRGPVEESGGSGYQGVVLDTAIWKDLL